MNDNMTNLTSCINMVEGMEAVGLLLIIFNPENKRLFIKDWNVRQGIWYKKRAGYKVS